MMSKISSRQKIGCAVILLITLTIILTAIVLLVVGPIKNNQQPSDLQDAAKINVSATTTTDGLRNQSLNETSKLGQNQSSLAPTDDGEPVSLLQRGNISVFQYLNSTEHFSFLQLFQGELAGDQLVHSQSVMYWRMQYPTNGFGTVFAPHDSDLLTSNYMLELLNRLSNPAWGAYFLDVTDLHFIQGEFLEEDMRNGTQLKSLSGNYVHTIIVDESGSPTLNGIPIVADEYIGTDGVVHRIVGLIASPHFFDTLEHYLMNHYKRFYEILVDTDVIMLIRESRGPDTVLAPTDEALNSLPYVILSNLTQMRDIALYHILPEIAFGVTFADALEYKVWDLLETRNEPLYLRWKVWLDTALDDSSIELLLEADGNYGRVKEGMEIVERDIYLNNGILQGIGKVIVPPSLEIINQAA